MANIQSAFATVQANAADDGGSVKAVPREGRIGEGLDLLNTVPGANLVWYCAVASAVVRQEPTITTETLQQVAEPHIYF